MDEENKSSDVIPLNNNYDSYFNNVNEEVKEAPIIPEPKTMKELIVDSIVSSKNFFVNDINKKISDSEEFSAYRLKLKINDEYKEALEENENLRPNKYGDQPLFSNESLLKKKTERILPISTSENSTPKVIEKLDNSALMKLEDSLAIEKKNELLNKIPEKYKIDTTDQKNDNLVLSLYKNQSHVAFRKNKLVQPDWHPPWKLYRVISGHTGWVRCVDVDPTNNWFVTGSNDKMIKFWDLASGKLKLSLTGHINTVRGVVVSPRHPYLFSCGEDKEIKCWDLEQNKVVRHYHGHLSGIYTIALHPTLDIIVTGGRDCVGRVWDIRSREQIFCLEGHTNTIASIACQEFNPQIITGSHDSTVKLWDMRAGKCLSTLTHHKKSIRSLITHHDEYTFLSGGCDNIKVWQCPEGRFLRNISGHNSIINSIALNRDGVLASGADNGSIYLWDYKSGYNFQQIDSKVQPGSLSSEAGIFAIKFDKSSTRMITAECDKTIKMWKEDEDATPEDFPINY